MDGKRTGGKRTLTRAKTKLEVISFRDEVPGPWRWMLKGDDGIAPDCEELGHLGILEENEDVVSDSISSDSKDAIAPDCEELGHLGILVENEDESEGSNDDHSKDAKLIQLRDDHPDGVRERVTI